MLGLRADMRWAAYPNRLSLALALVALAYVVRLARRPRAADALVAGAAAFGAAAMHMAAAEMLAAAGALVLAALVARELAAKRERTRDGGRQRRSRAAARRRPRSRCRWSCRRRRSCVTARSSASRPRISRRGSRVCPAGCSSTCPVISRAPGPALFLLGTAIGVAASVRAVRGGSAHDAAAGALARCWRPRSCCSRPSRRRCCSSRYYLTERIAILLPFTVFVGLAWALAQPRRDPLIGRMVTGAVVVALVAGPLAYALGTATAWSPESSRSVWRSRKDDVRLIWGTETVGRLSKAFGEGYPIVASDTETSYYLAGVLPVAVVGVTSAHTPFAVEAADGPARRADMETLMAPGTPEARRREILARRRADYVVVPKYRGGFAATLAEMHGQRAVLAPVFETRTLALFRVVRFARSAARGRRQPGGERRREPRRGEFERDERDAEALGDVRAERAGVGADTPNGHAARR